MEDRAVNRHIWPCRLTARTRGFHPRNRGSIPRRALGEARLISGSPFKWRRLRQPRGLQSPRRGFDSFTPRLSPPIGLSNGDRAGGHGVRDARTLESGVMAARSAVNRPVQVRVLSFQLCPHRSTARITRCLREDRGSIPRGGALMVERQVNSPANR